MAVLQQFKTQRVDIALSFAFDLPFRREDLQARAIKLGYEGVESEKIQLRDQTFNTPQVAKNKTGDAYLMLDESANTVGVFATETPAAIGALRDLLSILTEDLEVDLEASLDSADCDIHAHVITGKRPREAINRAFGNTERGREFSQIFGEDMSLCGVVIVPRARNPNDTTYFEIRINPAPENPAHYCMNVLFCSHEAYAVQKFLEDSQQKVLQMIMGVEK